MTAAAGRQSRKLIGYVPQDDIINTELSVRRTLSTPPACGSRRTTADNEVDAVRTTCCATSTSTHGPSFPW